MWCGYFSGLSLKFARFFFLPFSLIAIPYYQTGFPISMIWLLLSHTWNSCLVTSPSILFTLQKSEPCFKAHHKHYILYKVFYDTDTHSCYLDFSLSLLPSLALCFIEISSFCLALLFVQLFYLTTTKSYVVIERPQFRSHFCHWKAIWASANYLIFRTSEHPKNAYLMEFFERLNYVTKYMWITCYSAWHIVRAEL